MMAVMGMRNFECTLCGQTFKQMSGDLMVPGPQICVDCLQEVWDMDNAALTQYITTRLEERQREEMIQSMLQHIQWHKDKYVTLDALMKARSSPFGY